MVKSKNEEKRKQMLATVGQALEVLRSLSENSSIQEVEETVNNAIDLLIDSQR